MEEIEVPLEKTQEHIHEHAAQTHDPFNMRVALSSALLAVFAAIAALMAGHHSNEAMIERLKASDGWAYYQAKGIKAAVLQTRIEIVSALGKQKSPDDLAKLDDYKREQDEISEKSKEQELASEHHLVVHQIFARSVTFFQVAIATAAISVLTRRKRFWWVGLGFGFIGVLFLIQALLS